MLDNDEVVRIGRYAEEFREITSAMIMGADDPVGRETPFREVYLNLATLVETLTFTYIELRRTEDNVPVQSDSTTFERIGKEWNNERGK